MNQVAPIPLDQAGREQWAATLDAADAAGQTLPVPEALQGCTMADALDVHRRFAARVQARIGGRIIGTKIGGTTEATLQRLAIECPWSGPIFAVRSHASPARLPRPRLNACIVEAELAVRLCRDLPLAAAPSRAELLASFDQLRPAIELADSRFVNWPQCAATGFVADMGFAGAWVYGAPCSDWSGFDLLHTPVRLTVDGKPHTEGSGAMILGDPLRALALAAVDRHRRGQTLCAGEWVSLGSRTVPYPCPGPASLVADFGVLGQVSVQLEG